MRKSPLVPIAIALIVGIAVEHAVYGGSITFWLILLGVASLVGGMLLLLQRKSNFLTLIFLLSIVTLAIGGLRCHVDDPRCDTSHWSHRCPQPAYISMCLNETPAPRERSWKSDVKVLSVNSLYCRGNLQLYLRKDSLAATLRYGDTLLIHGYADTARGTLYVTSDHYIVTGRDSTSLRAWSERLRMSLLYRMQTGPLSHRQVGMAEAMTLGWRGDLESDLQAQFRDAGIMHLLCVSGLHVGLLAALVGWMLLWLGKERRGRILRGSLQLLTVWGFVLLTGMAPATLRAALMFSLFIISRMMGRRTDSMNLLAFAAIAMLLADPMLLFNAGWQLSFSAVAGILLVRPLLRIHRNILWQAVIVSLSATLATLPVCLSTFHQFHPWFLLANVIIVPLAGVLLGLSLLYMLLPCSFTAFLLQWPLEASDWLTGAVSRLPAATVDGLNPSTLGIIIIGGAVVLTLLAANRFVAPKEGN